MKGNASLQSPPTSIASGSEDPQSLWFLAVLGLIAVGSLLVRLYVSAAGYIEFEEWQHVFMASSARWADLRFELDTNAHPPLFFFLLRFLLHIGHSKLLYRSISIGSGVASVVFVGLIARKVSSSAIVALLCAGAFGFSAAAISTSSQIRSYELATAFVLLAFLSYLEILSQPRDKLSARPYVVFAIASSAAVLSHYFAALFLMVCVFLAFIQILVRGSNKSNFSSSNGLCAPLFLSGSLAVPLFVFLYLYIRHASNQPIQGYLYDFYYGFGSVPNETPMGFMFRNLQNLWNLFSPVTFHHRSAFILMLTLLCAATVYILIRQRSDKSERAKKTNLPIWFCLIMVLELVLLSLGKKYPFGGLLRHQYIVAPFLVMAIFVLLDRAVSLIAPPFRTSIFLLVAVSIGANCALSLPHLIVGRGILAYQSEFDRYRAAFPRARAVYLDGFGVIDYFSNTDKYPRHFVRRIFDSAFIDQYRIDDGSSEGVQLFYDKSRENLDLLDPGVYASFVSCLRESGVKELTLFYLSPGNRPLPQSPELLKRTITNAAAKEKLAVTKVAVNGIAVFAGFTSIVDRPQAAE